MKTSQYSNRPHRYPFFFFSFSFFSFIFNLIFIPSSVVGFGSFGGGGGSSDGGGVVCGVEWWVGFFLFLYRLRYRRQRSGTIKMI